MHDCSVNRIVLRNKDLEILSIAWVGSEAGLFGGYDLPGIAKSPDVTGLDFESPLNPFNIADDF